MRIPSPNDLLQVEILRGGRMDRARQIMERRQRDAEKLAQLEAAEQVQREQEEAAQAWPRNLLGAVDR